MKIEDTQLICIKSNNSGYTVFPKLMPGVVVEVEDLKEAPAKISKALESIFEYGFKNNIHIIKKLKNESI